MHPTPIPRRRKAVPVSCASSSLPAMSTWAVRARRDDHGSRSSDPLPSRSRSSELVRLLLFLLDPLHSRWELVAVPGEARVQVSPDHVLERPAPKAYRLAELLSRDRLLRGGLRLRLCHELGAVRRGRGATTRDQPRARAKRAVASRNHFVPADENSSPSASLRRRVQERNGAASPARPPTLKPPSSHERVALALSRSAAVLPSGDGTPTTIDSGITDPGTHQPRQPHGTCGRELTPSFPS